MTKQATVQYVLGDRAGGVIRVRGDSGLPKDMYTARKTVQPPL